MTAFAVNYPLSRGDQAVSRSRQDYMGLQLPGRSAMERTTLSGFTLPPATTPHEYSAQWHPEKDGESSRGYEAHNNLEVHGRTYRSILERIRSTQRNIESGLIW